MGPDRWKKQINSSPILEFKVLPSWHERAASLESVYCSGNAARARKWTNQHKWTGNMFYFFIFRQSMNRINMFIKRFEKWNVWCQNGKFFRYFICALAVNDFRWCEGTVWKQFHIFRQINILARLLFLCSTVKKKKS